MESSTALKRSALAVATIGSFITSFTGSAINIALPAIAQTFIIDAVFLSWIATAYLLAAGVALVPAGRIADIYGRKKVLTWGFVIFTLSSLFLTIAPSPVILILLRILQGIGNGLIFSTSMAILVAVFPPAERGKVLGISVAAVYIGLSTGPFLGGILTMHFTWRSLFLLNALLGSAVLGIIFLRLKGEWRDAQGEKFDIIGSFLYGVTLIAIIFGLARIPKVESVWFMLIGVSALLLFIKRESSIDYPVLKIALFKENRLFALSNLAALIHYSATFAVTFVLSMYLQYIKSYTPQFAGTILMAQPVVMALFSPFAGKLSDRREPRIISSLGIGITSCVLFMLSIINAQTNIFYLIFCLVILGFGFALFSAPNMNAIMSSVDKKYLGIASGVSGTMRVIGQMLSMAITTMLVTFFIGHLPVTPTLFPQLLKTTNVTLFIFGFFCLLGTFVSLLRGNVRKVSNDALR